MPSSTHWPRVFFLWVCGILAAMQFAKVSVAFQLLQQAYSVTPAAMGMVLSTVGLVGLLLGVTVGLFAQAIGYRRLLLAGLGLGTLLGLLQSLMPAYPLLLATRLLEGLSHLAVVVSAPTLIAACCAPRHRSIAMGLWSSFVGVAFALTAALGGWIMASHGVAGLLRWHAVAMALALALAWAWLRPDLEPAGGRRWPRFAALPGLHRDIYTRLATALPALCFFCYTIMAIALLTFIPQHAGQDRAWLAVLLPLMTILGAFCAGGLAQAWPSPLPLIQLAFAGVALAGLALWACSWLGVTIAPAAIGLMFMAGVAGGASFALIPYLSQDSALQARANGAVAQTGNLGSTLGPPLFGAATAALALPGLALSVVVFALLGIGVATLGTRH
jgi:AAHS family 3-hydroxyphenylpropionic acid transporter